MKFEYFVFVVEPTEETHQISLVSSIFLLTFPFCEVKTQNVVCTEAILYKDNQILRVKSYILEGKHNKNSTLF